LAANTSPIFPLTPVIGAAGTIATSTARTTVVGAGTNTAVTPTSTNGKRIDAIMVTCSATSAAACVTLWIYDGTNQYLFDEIPVSAVTIGTTVPAFSAIKYYPNLVLPPTYRLFAATTIAQNTNVFAFGGDY
jgi:hypothetical protein